MALRSHNHTISLRLHVTLGTRGTVVEDVVGVERDVLRVTRVDIVLAVVE